MNKIVITFGKCPFMLLEKFLEDNFGHADYHNEDQAFLSIFFQINPPYLDYNSPIIENFGTVDIYDEDEITKQSQDTRSVASLSFRDYPGASVLSIEQSYSSSPISEDDWNHVVSLSKRIIAKAKELGIITISVNPPEVLQYSEGVSSDPLEQITSSRDKQIIMYWLEGDNNAEIVGRIRDQYTPIEPRTVTNIISRLRTTHGEELIPKLEERNRRLRERNPKQ